MIGWSLKASEQDKQSNKSPSDAAALWSPSLPHHPMPASTDATCVRCVIWSSRASCPLSRCWSMRWCQFEPVGNKDVHRSHQVIWNRSYAGHCGGSGGGGGGGGGAGQVVLGHPDTYEGFATLSNCPHAFNNEHTHTEGLYTYIRPSSHEIDTQSSHSVKRAGWQAKMASSEFWTPRCNATGLIGQSELTSFLWLAWTCIRWHQKSTFTVPTVHTQTCVKM